MSNNISPSEKAQIRLVLRKDLHERLSADAHESHRKIYEQIAWIIERFYKDEGKKEKSNG